MTNSDEGIVQVQLAHNDRQQLEQIVNDLVSNHLIACGQVLGPMSSTFLWDGQVQREDEWLALLKTTRVAADALVRRIATAHAYEAPEVLLVDIEGGHEPYLEWVRACVRGTR